MAPALLSAGFQSLSPLPTIKLGPSGADSLVRGLVYIVGPVGLSNEPSCEAGSFSCCCLNPPWVFSLRGLRLYFPMLEPWVARPTSLPHHSSQFIYARKWGCRVYRCCTACPVCSTIRHLSVSGRVALSPLHPSCPSLSLLPVWMNVSSLSPWLSNFHTV